MPLSPSSSCFPRLSSTTHSSTWPSEISPKGLSAAPGLTASVTNILPNLLPVIWTCTDRGVTFVATPHTRSPRSSSLTLSCGRPRSMFLRSSSHLVTWHATLDPRGNLSRNSRSSEKSLEESSTCSRPRTVLVKATHK